MTLELETYEEEYLETRAQETGTTAELYARELLQECLENVALVQIADERMAEWKAEGGSAIPWASVKAENGL
jgi:hypothetical protein